MEAGDKARTLGDYVSNAKMKQVAETCARTHDDLRLRFEQVNEAVSNSKTVRRVCEQQWASTQHWMRLTDTCGDLETSLRRLQTGVTALEGTCLVQYPFKVPSDS